VSKSPVISANASNPANTPNPAIAIARLSAVVQLLDDLTGQPAVAAQPLFWLDAQPVHPQSKSNAFYVFENLPDGQYRLDIRFPKHRYFDQSVALHVPAAEPLAQAIVPCRLQPTPLYPYAAGSTMIFGQIRAAEGPLLSGVSVSAHYSSANGKAKTVTTQSCDFGRYQGRFAVALSGNLAPETQVQMVFEKASYSVVKIEIKLSKASQSSANVEMRKTQGK
jgi:hypothetical protein